MEGLRQWLLGIVLTAFAAGLARQMAPKGKEQAAVRLVGGLLLILAILGPLGKLEGGGGILPTGNFSRDARKQAEIYQKERQDALAAIISEKTESYIMDKACQLGLTCRATVITTVGESGIPLPDTVTVAGAYSPALADWMEEGVGIPAEKQIWLEENAWSERKKSE